MRYRLLCVCLCLAICMLSTIAWGQESRAVINGTVSDPQSAVIPGAKIEVKNVETNVVVTVETNARGLYTVPPLNPGQYAITVAASGFKNTVQPNVELRVADRLTLDFKLELGGTTETVTVTAEAPLLQTSSATQGTVMSKESVANLPLIGRNAIALAQYSAGTYHGANNLSSERPFDNGGMDSYNINGSGSNEFLMDGAPNTANSDVGSGGSNSLVFAPPPDAVAEFKMVTNMYDAEYGRAGGGVITVSLKSGANALHGTVYYFLRMDTLSVFGKRIPLLANTVAARFSNPVKPLDAYRWRQPGAQLQGPVYIPGVYNGKDKTFFMWNWEQIRSSTPHVTSYQTPNSYERQGDFSHTWTNTIGGTPIMIYDPTTTLATAPYTRIAFPNSRVPYINPIAANILKVYPQWDTTFANGEHACWS